MTMNLKPAVFLHIQKTAGTTIVDLARSAYGDHNVVSHGDYLKGASQFPIRNTWEEKAHVLDDFNNVPFLSGHFGYDFAKRYMGGRYSFTFLRDPVERVLSFYYFCKKGDPNEFEIYRLCQQIPLDEFLKIGFLDPRVKGFIWNNQVWQLACGFGNRGKKSVSSFEEIELLELAYKHIDEFSYIGFAETFETDRNCILKDLGIVPPEETIISNANPGRPTFGDLPQSTKDLLLELTELDRILYEKARSRKTAPLKEAVKNWPEVHLTSRPEGLPEKLQRVQNDYLELMQGCLTGSIYRDLAQAPFGSKTFDSYLRKHGLDWPSHAETMIGEKRLANLRVLTEAVIADNVPGDLIETGVWRGGACILMRAVLYAHNVSDRYVWVADSFEGLPRANEAQYPADAGSNFHTYAQLAVSLDEVQNNFLSYGLLDEQVKFLKGWFKDTLPTAPIGQLALMRLDGDMYQSTMDALTNLYPKLSHQGYVIIDDYHVVSACKAAVTDYCDRHGIKPEVVEIDGVGVYWRKTAVGASDRNRESLRLNQTVTSTDFQITRLSQAVAGLSRSVITRLNESLTERDAQITGLNRSLIERDAQITTLNQFLAERDAQITGLNRSVAGLYSSTSWKITEPLRAMKKFIDALQSPRKNS